MSNIESAGVSVHALLSSKSLAPALRNRIMSADKVCQRRTNTYPPTHPHSLTHSLTHSPGAPQDDNGELSVDEVLAVMRSEIDMARDRRMLRRVAAVLVAGLILTIAAVAGLTFAVVALSKDTASSGGALVDKASGAPLATGAVVGRQDLSALWQGADDASLAGLTTVFTTGADGVRHAWRVAGVDVVAGEWARVNTTEPGISLYINAEGVSLEGAGAEGGGGMAGAGRRRLLGEDSNTQLACAGCTGTCQCGLKKKCKADTDCTYGGDRSASTICKNMVNEDMENMGYKGAACRYADITSARCQW
jgi:hypothetical protein